MKILFCFFIIFLCVTQKCAKRRTTQPMGAAQTIGINERVALLKYQIAQEIKKNNFATEKILPIDNSDFSESYEYVNTDDAPITPIMDFDKRKKHGKFKLRELKTTTEQTQRTVKKHKKRKNKVSPIETTKEESSSSKEIAIIDTKIRGIDNAFTVPAINNKQVTGNSSHPKIFDKNTLRIKKKLRMSKSHTDNTFYRRTSSVDMKNINKYAIHCQDLITPYLTGIKTNITEVKFLNVNDNSVIRLIQLLNEDLADSTKDEIYSILYQISNIQIRLFQWDVLPLKLLFNTINKGLIISGNTKRHSFKTLKQGLKRKLASWHMDITNTTNLLKQARLFRPPCVRSTDFTGSTKTSKGVRYTKSTKPRCLKGGEDTEECYAEI